MPDAIEYGLGWVQFADVDFRLDLVEGEYAALRAAFERVRDAPDLVFARAEEWPSIGSRLARLGFVRLELRPHHRHLVRTSQQLLDAAPDDLADLLAKLAMIDRGPSRTRLPASASRRSDGTGSILTRARRSPSMELV